MAEIDPARLVKVTGYGDSAPDVTAAPAPASIPRDPTNAMLIAARDWAQEVFGRSISSEAAIGCWKAMWDAADKEDRAGG